MFLLLNLNKEMLAGKELLKGKFQRVQPEANKFLKPTTFVWSRSSKLQIDTLVYDSSFNFKPVYCISSFQTFAPFLYSLEIQEMR